MATRPAPASAANQMTMTGPNAHATRSLPRAWNGKETDRDDTCNEHQQYLGGIFKTGDEGDTFHRREHTDRRGDHTIANEKGNTDNGKKGDKCNLVAGF